MSVAEHIGGPVPKWAVMSDQTDGPDEWNLAQRVFAVIAHGMDGRPEDMAAVLDAGDPLTGTHFLCALLLLPDPIRADLAAAARAMLLRHAARKP
ncbi:hypothetical protein ACW2Q0_18945 [Nocardia sp. R16R-3T]